MADVRRGVAYGISAYLIWGMFPLYLPLLRPANAVEILAHRIIWSLVVVVAILAVRRHWSWLRDLRRQPRRLGLLALAAVLIAINWGAFIYSVNTGHTLDASLGYFINPLVSVVLGVLVFRERLHVAQWVAVGLGGAAVLVLTAGLGRVPWLSLLMAGSFATYGLIKKFANTGSAESLTVETLVLLAPALGYVLVLEYDGVGTFVGVSAAQAVLLAGVGIVTAVPLMFFNAAAIRVPLSTIGMLQYLTPSGQFLIGWLVFHEEMPLTRWIGFTLVWTALAVLTCDQIARARGRARAATRPPATPSAADPAPVTAVAAAAPGPDQPVREMTKSQMDSNAARAGTSGNVDSSARASSTQPRISSLARRIAGLARSRRSASACRSTSVRSARSSARSRSSDGSADPSTCSTGSVGTPSRRSVPGVLPDCDDSEAISRMSSDS
jgi:chloramphenicol-sensitive protein RarD